MKRIYVKESTRKNVDGEILQVVETYESEVKGYQYIVFLDKRQ